MDYLIDSEDQDAIAAQIDTAVENTLAGFENHGNEEALTSVLGQELIKQSFSTNTLAVKFSYRQLNKQTEEPHAGADGGFLVRVETNDEKIEKAALFQAKLLRGQLPPRQLTMRRSDAQNLIDQAKAMLDKTPEAVIVFYTESQIYVVDADKYRHSQSSPSYRPLSNQHRLITLGTYLGRWLPRCTRGDQSEELVERVVHRDGFRRCLMMDVIRKRPSVRW